MMCARICKQRINVLIFREVVNKKIEFHMLGAFPIPLKL